MAIHESESESVPPSERDTVIASPPASLLHAGTGAAPPSVPASGAAGGAPASEASTGGAGASGAAPSALPPHALIVSTRGRARLTVTDRT